ncbi:hypothetical protein P1X14_02075 [Sphingomonas sp. AOB5]|uniref:hypothetical protein n=1 Tax=Sphingomonas sp. AOB5 TaxID=3034017 RepID=UPI0023F8A689|nr:hypothetical protein [Sphingomonas sp. AOB5]MDF7774021.1 hypothetical protein [Sphingomonas sp. AOB5]
MIRACLIALLTLFLAPIALANGFEDPDTGELPAGFQGQVAYFGNYTGRTSVMASRNSRAPDVPCPYKDNRCWEQVVGGGVKVVLTFNGDQVTGFYFSVGGFIGPNGLSQGSLTGRRTPGGCELFEADGTTWVATLCNRREFRGQIISVKGIPKQSDVRFGTVGMFVRDLGWVNEQTGRIESRNRRIDWLGNRLNRPGTDESHFRIAIELDSYSRRPYGLDDDRLSPPTVPSRWNGARNKAGKNRRYFMETTYTRRDNSTGRVGAVLYNGNVECVQWEGEECQPIRPPIVLTPPQPDDDGGWLSRSTAPIVMGGN